MVGKFSIFFLHSNSGIQIDLWIFNLFNKIATSLAMFINNKRILQKKSDLYLKYQLRKSRLRSP